MFCTAGRPRYTFGHQHHSLNKTLVRGGITTDFEGWRAMAQDRGHGARTSTAWPSNPHHHLHARHAPTIDLRNQIHTNQLYSLACCCLLDEYSYSLGPYVVYWAQNRAWG